MAESTLLSPKDVVITRTVAKFGNTSYQIAASSSVSAQHRESVNWNFVSTGLLLIIAVLVIGYFGWVSWIQVGIAGGIIVVITINGARGMRLRPPRRSAAFTQASNRHPTLS